MSYLSESLVGYYRLLTSFAELRFNVGSLSPIERHGVIAEDELAELPTELDLEREPEFPLLWRRANREYRLGTIRVREDSIRDVDNFVAVARDQNIRAWRIHLMSTAMRSVIRSHGSYSRFYTRQLCAAILETIPTGDVRQTDDLISAARLHRDLADTDTTMWSLARLLELLATLTTALTHQSIRLMSSITPAIRRERTQ